MCVICVSEKGIKQPGKELMRKMWNRNPHGAGYMFARSNYVYIRKGFMSFDEFYEAVKNEHFTKDDAVVYHFRISTQGGINPGMTHPFMLTDDIRKTTILRTRTNVGIVHNGIIHLNDVYARDYSDTAMFITRYLSKMVERPKDLQDPLLLDRIYRLVNSRMCFMDYKGNISACGEFIQGASGLYYSNACVVE